MHDIFFQKCTGNLSNYSVQIWLLFYFIWTNKSFKFIDLFICVCVWGSACIPVEDRGRSVRVGTLLP